MSAKSERKKAIKAHKQEMFEHLKKRVDETDETVEKVYLDVGDDALIELALTRLAGRRDLKGRLLSEESRSIQLAAGKYIARDMMLVYALTAFDLSVSSDA